MRKGDTTAGFTDQESEAMKAELAAGGVRSRSPDADGMPHMPRPPTEARQPQQKRAQSAPSAPPDHTRRVKPSWKPNSATAQPLPSDGSSAVGRWASASPWRERPGEHDANATPVEEWPFRILQPRHDQEREVGVPGYRRDVAPTAARTMVDGAVGSRALHLNLGPEGGGSSSIGGWVKATPRSATTRAWYVAPPIVEAGKVEYRYHSETERPVSAVTLTSDRDLDAPKRSTTPEQRFVFPSRGGPRHPGSQTAR